MVPGYIEVKDVDVNNKREVRKQVGIRMALLNKHLSKKTRYLLSKEIRHLIPKIKGISITKSTEVKTEGLFFHETVTTIREYSFKDVKKYTQITLSSAKI